CEEYGIDIRIVRNRLRKYKKLSQAHINRTFNLVRAPKIVVNGICFRNKDAALEYLGIDEATLAQKLPTMVIRYQGRTYQTVKELADTIGVPDNIITERLRRLGRFATPKRLERCIDGIRKEQKLTQPVRIANEEFPSVYSAARRLGLQIDRLYDALFSRFGYDWPDNPSMQDIFPTE
ncbi:hypothetical protein, partial [Thiolapillus sp.]